MSKVTVIVIQHKTKSLLVQRHSQVKPLIVNWVEEKLSV